MLQASYSQLCTDLPVVDEAKPPVRQQQHVPRVGVPIETAIYKDLMGVYICAQK